MEACAIFTQELAPRLTAPSCTSLAEDADGEKREWRWSDFPRHGGWQSDVGVSFPPFRLGASRPFRCTDNHNQP